MHRQSKQQTTHACIALINGKAEPESIRYSEKAVQEWCIVAFNIVCKENKLPTKYKTFKEIEAHCSIIPCVIVY